MSILEPVAEEIFTISITKSLQANPAVRWRNTYEARFETGSTPAQDDLLGLADALLHYEQDLHLPGVTFVQTVISTYAQDSDPYDPLAFQTIPHPGGLIGQRAAGGTDPLDLTAAFYVRRQVATGRQGKLFYRGVLVEGDVNSPAGTMRLTNPAIMQTLVDDAVTNNGLGDYMYPAAEGGLMLVMAGSGVARQILQLQAAGATRVSNDHRWYNVGGG